MAAGTQNAINIAVALGVLPRKAPCTIVNVRLPAPSREEAAALYVDRATAAPVGLYEGAAHVDVEKTQLGAVHAVQVPVSISGMDVAPGEIIHMDENGAVKFPADRLEDVVRSAKALLAEEDERVGQLLKVKGIAAVKAIMARHQYVKK